jgi:hypothetical protein
MAAVYLNDQARRRRQEVSDGSAKQRHLTTKHYTEPAAANASPEYLLRRRKRSAHFAGAIAKDCRVCGASIAKQGLSMCAITLSLDEVRRAKSPNGRRSPSTPRASAATARLCLKVATAMPESSSERMR